MLAWRRTVLLLVVVSESVSVANILHFTFAYIGLSTLDLHFAVPKFASDILHGCRRVVGDCNRCRTVLALAVELGRDARLAAVDGDNDVQLGAMLVVLNVLEEARFLPATALSRCR